MDDQKDAAAEPEAAAGRGMLERIRSGMAAAREPITDRVGHAWHERPGARVRRVRGMAKQPLPYLYDVHPEARFARPVEVGLRTIDIDEIGGTAVGGAFRGGDYLPRKAARTKNWAARWQRLRKAGDSLAMLPPIDVFKYGGRYWVVDGHNRVAMAKYGGQASIDADVTDLVDPASPPPDPRRDPAESFASLVEDSRQLRAAVHRSASRRASNVPPGLPEPARAEPPSAIQREQDDAEGPR